MTWWILRIKKFRRHIIFDFVENGDEFDKKKTVYLT